MTERLYYLDSHMLEFSARVLECREEGDRYALVLDRTAFFPGGGGQAADTGYIGEARVLGAHERGGELLHYCDRALPLGAELPCRLDREQRLRRMQNHSGEHIVSGLVHKLYGLDNVGFHMGADCMTIDLSAELDGAQLERIERLANEAVRADLPVTAGFPDPELLRTMEYRSKLELTEGVRIVEIEGVDRCACCAPHVQRTGEVGLVKVLDFERHRGGVRISLLCGMDALEDYAQKQRSVTAISRSLSVKRPDTAAAVERLLAEQQRQKERGDALSMELVRHMAASCPATDANLIVFDALLDETAQRELVNLLTEKCSGLAAVFCGSDGEGWRYVIGSRNMDLRAGSRQLNKLIGGKGGGSPRMLQGRASAPREQIQKNLENTVV